MPRQMPTTPGPRIRAQARGGSLLLTFPIGGRGSRHRRPLPDRPPTLQAFRSVLSETTSVSTRRLIKGSRSYLRRHGVQSRGAVISYHKLTLSVYRKFCWNIPTFGKRYRALGGPCAFLRASEGFWSMFCRECECRHPVSSSNSICKSPHSSRGHFHPRHFPWRTKSQRRPSAIA